MSNSWMRPFKNKGMVLSCEDFTFQTEQSKTRFQNIVHIFRRELYNIVQCPILPYSIYSLCNIEEDCEAIFHFFENLPYCPRSWILRIFSTYSPLKATKRDGKLCASNLQFPRSPETRIFQFK